MTSKVKKDAFFIGMWKDDVVTDNIIKEVASRSTMDKGRKVKLRLTPEGLLIAKPSIFQSSAKLDSIPIQSMYFMTVNKHNPNCLLCIIRDSVRKYNVLAFRCVSALDAGELVTTFKSIRGDDMAMMKRDDGNWTLRNRSSKYTQRQMIDIGETKPSNGVQPNGDALHEHVLVENVVLSNINEEEAVTKGEELVIKGKLLQNIGVQTHLHDEGDNMSEISDVSSFKEELDYLSQELREVKYLLEKSTGISAEEHLRMAKEMNNANNNNSLVFDKMHQRKAIRYTPNDDDTVYTDKEGVAHAIVPDYRSFGVQTVLRTRGGRHHHYNNASTAAVAAALRNNSRYVKVNNQSRINMSNGQEHRTIVNGRLVSVPATQPLQVHTGSTRVVYQTSQDATSGRDSLKLKYDRPPAPLPTDEKSKSLRVRSQTNVSVPTSVERPIEYTYSARMRDQYVIGQPLVSRKVRPRSMYIISGSRPLSVHNPTQQQKLVTTNEAPI